MARPPLEDCVLIDIDIQYPSKFFAFGFGVMLGIIGNV